MVEHHFVQANGIKIHYVTAGQGPPVLLLHGFPEFWYCWRYQIPALEKKFQLIIPDLRGYNETEKPTLISVYDVDQLVADAVGLLDVLGHKKAHIVGHDWGGAVAWQIALQHPEVVDRLAVLNCPHPALFARALKGNYQQMLKSWYFFFFQLPYLPELLFKIRGKKILEDLFRKAAVRKDAFSSTDIQKYFEALQKPDALASALNYYRAAFRKMARSKPIHKKITVPTLLIWGEQDTSLGKELTYNMEGLFEAPFNIQYIPNCGHFVNEEQPEIVNKLLLEFIFAPNAFQ